METFYLGTHEPWWLDKIDIPLLLSNRRIKRVNYKSKALGKWVLDSGGYSELHKNGKWSFTEQEYVQDIQRYVERIGSLEWAAPMDWMCEPSALSKTGKTVKEHQSLTIESFLILRELLGDLVIPVIQGWELEEYEENIEQYASNGIDLSKERTVGIGSICRRGAFEKIGEIIEVVHSKGIKIHAFGVKGKTLRVYKDKLISSDSAAWSYNASLRPPLPGHTHKRCSSCMEYALLWRERLLKKL
jgi:hypothetical protein